MVPVVNAMAGRKLEALGCFSVMEQELWVSRTDLGEEVVTGSRGWEKTDDRVRFCFGFGRFWGRRMRG